MMNFYRVLIRHELEKLREEHRKTEEARLEKEEEMWRLHELHKGEMDAQKHSLAKQQEHHQRERAKREAELETERQAFLEDKQKCK